MKFGLTEPVLSDDQTVCYRAAASTYLGYDIKVRECNRYSENFLSVFQVFVQLILKKNQCCT